MVDERVGKLGQIGFVLCGTWRMAVPERISYELSLPPTKRNDEALNALYAFVVDGELKYIGKTTKGLRYRMSNYQNAGKTQVTNLRNRGEILKCLALGQTVEIYALLDTGLLSYGGFDVNLAAGLEDSLIKTLSPKWNFGLKETRDEGMETVEA